MKRKVLFIPLVVFALLVAAFMFQLHRNMQGDDPDTLESALIGKPVPPFQLPALFDDGQQVTQQVLHTGKPLLLNVWGTWCPTCRAEHEYLRSLAGTGITIIGVNYKDDREKARHWLTTLGNPYAIDLFDANGTLALNIGVYGAPETFLIDGQGIIRYRHVGAMTAEVWRNEFAARWDALTRGGAQ